MGRDLTPCDTSVKHSQRRSAMGDAEADKLSAMLTSIKLAQYYRTFINKGYTSISACQVGPKASHAPPLTVHRRCPQMSSAR
jgi:hypothetical protein